jgi:hypothetical protein
MKNVLFILAFASLAVISCSKDKEGCNDRRASNYDSKVVVDDGSCIFTDLTFYADSSHIDGIAISKIEVTVNGSLIGSFNGYFNNGNQVCGATNTAVFETNGESEVAWSAVIYQLGGTTVSRSGVYTGIEEEACVIQQILP